MTDSQLNISIVIGSRTYYQGVQWLVDKINMDQDYSLVHILKIDDPQDNFAARLLYNLDRRLFVDQVRLEHSYISKPYSQSLLSDSDQVIWLSAAAIPENIDTSFIYANYYLDNRSYDDLRYMTAIAFHTDVLPSVFIQRKELGIVEKTLDKAVCAIHEYSLARILKAIMWRTVYMLWENLTTVESDHSIEIMDTDAVVSVPSILNIHIDYFKKLIAKTIRQKRSKGQWVLILNKRSQSWKEGNTLEPSPKEFWADPFLVDNNGQTFLFFEVLEFKTDKGHLSVAEVNNDLSIGEPIKIIDEAHHLSYPHIFSYKNEMYLIPESSAVHRIDLYKATNFPFGWIRQYALMNDVTAYDSTVFYHDGLWWMFTCIQPLPDMNENEELHLFFADSPIDKKWNPHPMNPIITDPRYARPAGDIRVVGDSIIRVSQDCSKLYGQGMNFHRITHLSTTYYSEGLTHNADAFEGLDFDRMHTFNKSREWEVIDAHRQIKR